MFGSCYAGALKDWGAVNGRGGLDIDRSRGVGPCGFGRIAHAGARIVSV